MTALDYISQEHLGSAFHDAPDDPFRAPNSEKQGAAPHCWSFTVVRQSRKERSEPTSRGECSGRRDSRSGRGSDAGAGHTSLVLSLSMGVWGDMEGLAWLDEGELEMEEEEEEWLCWMRSGKRWMRPAKPLLSV